MAGILQGMRSRLRRTARATALGVAGIVFGMVGTGFLTVALWIVIDAHEGALVAFAVLGALYVVLAFCLLALGTQQGGTHGMEDTPPSPRSAAKDPLSQVAEGFAVGLQAGRAARRDPRD